MKRGSGSGGGNGNGIGSGSGSGSGSNSAPREVALMGSEHFANDSWVLDSGASGHMTSDFSKLFNVEELKPPRVIYFGNGTTGMATHIGNVVITNISGSQVPRLVLGDVLYVPEAQVNLLSIGYATTKGVEFSFGAYSCKLSKAGFNIGEADYNAGLYYLQGNTAKAYVSTASQSAELWHRRFGHLGYDNLHKLVLDDMVKGINVPAQSFKSAKEDACEPCIAAKQHRVI
jgi:hypothetical protein